MKYFHIFFLTCSLTLAGNRALAGFSDPMSFFVASTGGNCANCGWIVGEGVIGPDTHARFIEFLSGESLLEARGLRIHLNSPGGDLIGGLQLGNVFRQQQINTAVSAAHITQIYDSGLRITGSSVDAECSSACVFAFAGGVNRYASENTPPSDVGFQSLGRLGVHQFYDPDSLIDPTAATLNAEDRIADQRIVSLLLGFISEMGVSAELIQLAAATDPRSMHYLTEAELRRVRVDTGTDQKVGLYGYRNGIAVAEIEYARGEGEFRLELFCENDTMQMIASVEWFGPYDVEAHKRWNLLDDVSLTDGAALVLLSEDFSQRIDGGTNGRFRFRFEDRIEELVTRDRFLFEDWSSRTANESVSSFSFVLPDDFYGLHVLPRTCI